MPDLGTAPPPPCLPLQGTPPGTPASSLLGPWSSAAEHTPAPPTYSGALISEAKPINSCGCGKLAAGAVHGPYLRCQGYQPDSGACHYTCLLVAKAGAVPGRPTLRWSDTTGNSSSVAAFCLDR
jgi:hypothetical protein